ncbi:hypothetical protein EG329_008144 [Mollisiaceae sp. DMI_Dod_QoI]|nr:hypothetical protein EG329_008144 [Helotiales sp. DMI_Dod_QoI]
MTPQPELDTPPHMGCLLSHPNVSIEAAPVQGYQLEHQIIIEQPAQYQQLTLQDLRSPQAPDHGAPVQQQEMFSMVPTQNSKPEHELERDREREYSAKQQRHVCEACLHLSHFPIKPVRCPLTGESIITEQELERIYRACKNTVTARDIAQRRADVRRAMITEVRAREEEEDSVPDIIEGGFGRADINIRVRVMTSGARRRLREWIEDCRQAGCVGFWPGYAGAERGIFVSRNREDEGQDQSERVVYADATQNIGNWW